MQYAVRFTIDITNNEVEYEALCAGLRIAKSLRAQNLSVFSDSENIVNQVQGQYQTKEERMKWYLKKVTELQQPFKHFRITRIPLARNVQGNKLSKLSTYSSVQLGRAVLIEELTSPTMERKINLIAEVEKHKDCWMTTLFKYLKEGRLPFDKALAKKVKLKSPQYVIQSGKLYRRS